MKGRILIAGLALLMAFGFSGCGKTEEQSGNEPPVNPCEHPYTEWISGEDTHYQECPICGQRHDEEPHRYVNFYGQSYTLRENATAMVRVSCPENMDGQFFIREIWVYVGPSSAELQLGRGTTASSKFYDYNDLVLTGKSGWYEVELNTPLNGSVYPYFRLMAVGGEIPLREIVFLGGAEGEAELLPVQAEKVHALVDCQQKPDSLYACEVCGKERP